MENIDKIVFGDNQFFGINHMSQEKAQQLNEKFPDLKSIISVYESAFDCGIKAVMLNSNIRANEICKYFRENEAAYEKLNWYPSIPYPHKYASLVAEKGILPAITNVLIKDNSTKNILGMMARGGSALLGKDPIKMMKMLIDVELRAFRGLNVKAIFLQNIITDLILGYGIKEIFIEYCAYIENNYKVMPGLITQNMPYLLNKLREWGIKNVIICSSINSIGYLMSPSVDSYIEVIKNNDPNEYKIMAMSTLASGAIHVKEAFDFINRQNIDSVVFGASSYDHIKESVEILNN